jgi:hypothetical protein
MQPHLVEVLTLRELLLYYMFSVKVFECRYAQSIACTKCNEVHMQSHLQHGAGYFRRILSHLEWLFSNQSGPTAATRALRCIEHVAISILGRNTHDASTWSDKWLQSYYTVLHKTASVSAKQWTAHSSTIVIPDLTADSAAQAPTVPPSSKVKRNRPSHGTMLQAPGIPAHDDNVV